MEMVKMILLTDTNQKIFDRYAELVYELTEVRACTPKDFETIAALSSEIKEIKLVIDRLSETKFF